MGNNNLLMESVHVAHDALIGNGCIIGNSTKMAGEIVIDDNSIISANVLMHQFCRVGGYGMIQGGCRFSKDIPPYIIAGREPICYAGLNIVGLRRRGFSNETIEAIHNAYRLIYQSGLNTTDALNKIEAEMEMTPEIRYIVDFIRSSTRGIIPGEMIQTTRLTTKNQQTETMIYRFTIISDEVDDFVREIQIDPEATFYDFHEAILKSVGYTNDQMTSFFICDEDWEKEKEVTLEEMDDNSEMDSWVMKDTRIDELVEDEKQKLLYVFDYMTERCFFIELSEIITGKNMKGAKCTKKQGEAPKQTVDFEEFEAKNNAALDLDENFYGDEDFDMDDFDKDGFEGFDEGGGGNPYDEDRY